MVSIPAKASRSCRCGTIDWTIARDPPTIGYRTCWRTDKRAVFWWNGSTICRELQPLHSVSASVPLRLLTTDIGRERHPEFREEIGRSRPQAHYRIGKLSCNAIGAAVRAHRSAKPKVRL